MMSSKKKVPILVGICSCIRAKDRRDAVRETWLQVPVKGIECFFFVGGGVPLEDEKADMVVLDAPDGYYELPEKVFHFFRYALDHYEFDWLFKCDDDTYLRLDRLSELTDPEYDLIGDALVRDRQAPSGGAGYFLSRSMVEKLVALPDFPLRGAEDLIVGELVSKLGGKMLYTPRLYMSNAYYPDESNDMVSAHWLSPELLRGVHLMTYSSPVTICNGRHTYWSDEVRFYANGFFRRSNTGCYGQWSIGFHGELILKWQTWSEEQLLPFYEFYIGSSLVLTQQEGYPSLQEIAHAHSLGMLQTTESYEGIRVHLGGGEKHLCGWLNLGLPNYGIRRPLPWKDSSVSTLFLEKEPVSANEITPFLKEAYRILQPGGTLRICPDLSSFLNETMTPEWQKKMIELLDIPDTPPYAVQFFKNCVEHPALFVIDSLTNLLRQSGFNIRQIIMGDFEPTDYIEQEKRPSGIDWRENVCLEAVKPLSSCNFT